MTPDLRISIAIGLAIRANGKVGAERDELIREAWVLLAGVD